MDTWFKIFGSIASAEGKLFGWSDEFRRFYSSGYRCPSCGKRLLSPFGTITLNFYSIDGQKMPMWQFALLRADVAECPKCGRRWKVRVKSADPVFEIVETERSEESFGTDKRVVDNSKSSVKVTRRFSVQKEWSRTYSIEYERATSGGLGISGDVKKVLGFNAAIDLSVREKFCASDQIKEVYSEEIGVEVPALTKLAVLLHWKKVWQHGFVVCRGLNDEELKVPFRAVAGVTFDQTEVDEPT